MSLWDEDGWGFNTRDGVPTGHANERTMLEAIGGRDQIRTKIITNPDGGTTMLRTRGGFPVFTTTETQVTEVIARLLYGCIGVPVSLTNLNGYKGGESFVPMGAPLESEAPGSGVAFVTTEGVTFEYNKQVYSKAGDPSLEYGEHPGNRSWRWKAKNKTISWWSPAPLSGRAAAYSGNDETKQFLGGTQQVRRGVTANTYTAPYAAWVANKMAIYIDGIKVCSLPYDSRWVFAAAAREVTVSGSKQTEILALLSSAAPLSAYVVGDGKVLLVRYNIKTGDYSEIGISSASPNAFNLAHNFAFCESAIKVAYVAGKAVVEMDTTTGAESKVIDVTDQTRELPFGPRPASSTSDVNAWYCGVIAVGPQSDTITTHIVRGFFYIADRLAFAKLHSTLSYTYSDGELVEVTYGGIDSDGVDHSGRLYLGASRIAAGNGMTVQATQSGYAALDGMPFDGWSKTTSVQVTASAGGQEQKPGGGQPYDTVYDQSVSGSGEFSVSSTGTGADFALVTDRGDAIILRAQRSLEYSESFSAYRPAFGGFPPETNVTRTGSSMSVPTTAELRFFDGTTITLPGGGESYDGLGWTDVGGLGNCIYRGGIASDFAGDTSLVSIVAVKATTSQYDEFFWAHTSARIGGALLPVSIAWPGSFAYFEAPVFSYLK